MHPLGLFLAVCYEVDTLYVSKLSCSQLICFQDVKLSFYYVSSLKTSRVVVCRHAWGGAYATEMLTYDHRQARKLRHCGVTPLWCRHTTTGMHGSCATVELHRYGADIRPQACMEAAPLRRYTAMVQT